MGYWFPQASVYRNAYLEEVGRHLTTYGMQLTTDADAAMEDLYPVAMVQRRERRPTPPATQVELEDEIIVL